jgi:hypothetical protein
MEKFHNKELCDLYSSPSIIIIVKWKRVIWAGHRARMGSRGTHTGYWWYSQREIDS